MEKTQEKNIAAVDYAEFDEEVKKEMKTKKKMGIGKKIVLFFSFVLIVGLSIAYYKGVMHFREHFFFNTWVNGVDFSQRTTADARHYIESKAENFYMTIIGADGTSENIYASEVDLIFTAEDVIEELFEAQNPFAWPLSWWNEQEIVAEFTISFDEALLDERIANLDIVINGQTAPVSANVVIEADEVHIIPEQYGNIIYVDVLQDLIHPYVATLSPVFDANRTELFMQPELITTSPVIMESFAKADTYLSTHLTYLVGTEVVVDRQLISEWLSIDDEFNVHLDEGQVWNWLEAFIPTVNTHGTTRSLTTPQGRHVTVTGGYYGWIISRDLEFAELLANIRSGANIEREPIYFQRATSHGPQDWGNTFLQVDMTTQHMWAIINGEIVFEAPVITGLPEGNRATPEGVYFILEMLSPTVLIGATDPETGEPIYETPVAYWMRTTWSGHGFHDATWQTEGFGGTLYRTRGSHGCTNLSLADARTLYGLIYLMMPVVVHH